VHAATAQAARCGGVALSPRHGGTFACRAVEGGLASTTVEDVFVDGSSLCAAACLGLGVSTHGGTSFWNRSLGASNSPGCIYASGTAIWAGSTGDLQNSVGGAAFSVVQASTGLGKAIAVSGTGFYFATTSGLWASNTSGAAGSFTLKGTADGLGSAFVLDVAVDGSGKVLAATDSGLSVSANSGSSFTSVTVPAPPRGIYAVGSTWYLPTSQGLSISTDAGSTWISYNGSQGVPPPANDVLFSP